MQQNDSYQDELQSLKNEYAKVFSFYQVEMTERINLEKELQIKCSEIDSLKADLERVTKEENSNDISLVQYHNLKNEFKRLQTSHDKKCEELKHQKSDIENVTKEKNDLSVALKRSKKETKESIQSFEKEKRQLEKNVFDLNEFRVKILNEEREERIRIKKENKKSKQKQKEEAIKEQVKTNRNTIKIEESNEIFENFEDEILEEANVQCEIKPTKENNVSEANCGDLVENLGTQDDSIKMEDSEGFIGPKLPPLMSKAEIEEFQRELFAKLDKKLESMWSK